MNKTSSKSKKLTTTKTAQTPASRRMSKEKVHQFFQILAQTIKEPVTELNYCNEFELLIAVILSAQATDKSVNIATNKLFKVANTPKPLGCIMPKQTTSSKPVRIYWINLMAKYPILKKIWNHWLVLDEKPLMWC